MFIVGPPTISPVCRSNTQDHRRFTVEEHFWFLVGGTHERDLFGREESGLELPLEAKKKEGALKIHGQKRRPAQRLIYDGIGLAFNML